MRTRKTVSTDTLFGYSACLRHTEIFGFIFGWGKRVEINRKNLRKAREAGLDIGWFLSRGLSAKDIHTYHAEVGRKYKRLFAGHTPTRTELEASDEWQDYMFRHDLKWLRRCR